jgi:acyl-coenzyme A thioesterase PaaI-like protein
MTVEIVMDGPDDRCFGCGQANHAGLRMRFRKTALGAEADYTVPDDYNGTPGVVHGGIQAALLDEVMGVGVHLLYPDAPIVTASFNLRYRRPVPTNTPLVIRSRVVREEPPSVFLEGEITSDGEVLTSAEARWRIL